MSLKEFLQRSMAVIASQISNSAENKQQNFAIAAALWHVELTRP
jgi:hypothetical protein